MFGQDKISLHGSQEATNSLQLALVEMGKESQKSRVLSLACLLTAACCDGHLKDWPAVSKMLH